MAVGSRDMAHEVQQFRGQGPERNVHVKRPVGGRLSDGQRNFLDAMNRNGAVGIVVNGIESLESQLKEAGVKYD